jgi:hypothetical protein
MTKDYLQIMIESLEKKIEILDKVVELDKRQLTISLQKPTDMKAYNATMEEKGSLISELEKLDDGFTNTYELVKEEVTSNPQLYREQVLAMQELIQTAIEKGVTVEAQEKRNKQAMESMIGDRRAQIRQMRVSSSAASKYYRAMSKINDVDPQLLDRKK